MLTLGFIKKEKKMMDSFKEKIELVNLNVLNDIDHYFEDNKDKGFKLKSLNKFFIEHGFIYDMDADRFEYNIYNKSIQKEIQVAIYQNCITFECGLLSSTNLYEIPTTYNEEESRIKILNLLNDFADNFINTLREYANAHGGVILDKEEDGENE